MASLLVIPLKQMMQDAVRTLGLLYQEAWGYPIVLLVDATDLSVNIFA
jgi:hypothetical protein